MKIVLQDSSNGKEKIFTEVERVTEIEDGVEVIKTQGDCTIYESTVISEVSGCDLLLYVDRDGQKHTEQASSAVQHKSGTIHIEQSSGSEDTIDGWICGATYTGSRGYNARFEQ